MFSLTTLLCSIDGNGLFSNWANRKTVGQKVLVLGTGEIAGLLFKELKNGHNPGLRVLGFVAENASDPHTEIPASMILGSLRDFKTIIGVNRPDVMVVAISERRGALPYEEILDCKMQGIEIEDWPGFYEKLAGKILVTGLRPSWLIFSIGGFSRKRVALGLKRLIDILLSVLGLGIALPLMLIIAIAIKLDSTGPILFMQERVGERGKMFTLVKFRTMADNAEEETGPVWAQTADPRITRVGKILRYTWMDELPQIFNVLRGEMSFVGPRPERPYFVSLLQKRIPYYTQRLTIKPGVTGWAQVCYGYGATIEDAIEKLQYDLYYVKNMSVFLDFRIILTTAFKVVRNYARLGHFIR